MQNDILFDNIYIGHSIADAETFGNQTFTVKKEVEKKEEEASKPEPEAADKTPKSPSDLVFMDDPVTYVKEKVQLFVEIAKRDPVQAVKFVPEVAAGLGVGVVTLLLLLVGAGGAGAKAAPSQEEIKAKAKQAQAKAQQTKDQVAEAVASGTERVKDEANKRTTRSSS